MNDAYLQKVYWEPLLQAGIEAWLIREDNSNPIVPGPKYWRARAWMEKAILARSTEILTTGGMHSNHLHAVAVLAYEARLSVKAYVRGLAHNQPNPLLEDCQRLGMELIPTTKLVFDGGNLGTANPTLSIAHGAFFIPMGAGGSTGHLALVHHFQASLAPPWPDVIALTAGTGATLRAILAVIPKQVQVLVAAPFKNVAFLQKEVSPSNLERLTLLPSVDGARFGKLSEDAKTLSLDFEAQTQVTVDNLYMPNLLVHLQRRALTGHIPMGTKLWVLHCGGATYNRLTDNK